MRDRGISYPPCVTCRTNRARAEPIARLGRRRPRTGRERPGEEADRRAVGRNRRHHHYSSVVAAVRIDSTVTFGFPRTARRYRRNHRRDLGSARTRSAAVVRNIHHPVDVCDAPSDDRGDHEDYRERDHREAHGARDRLYAYGDVDDCVRGDLDVLARPRAARPTAAHRAQRRLHFLFSRSP